MTFLPSRLRTALGLCAVLFYSVPACLSGQERPAPPPAEIVAQMVRTEVAAYKSREYFLYRQKVRSARTKGHLWDEVVVETPEGRMHRLLSQDGKPLSGDEQKTEDDRITSLVNHPDQFRREAQARKDDETRLAVLLQELTKVFLFATEGMEGDCTRIAFRPNPGFEEQTYQDRVIHATSGFLFIHTPDMRICGLDAHLDHRVEFGYGLLGKVSETSRFSMTRKQVMPGEWKTTRVQIHIDGSVFMLKSYARDEDGIHYAFRPVAANLSVAQAAALVRAEPF